ncbi:MAG: phage holin [Clostridia bacterium]|nr:phage holin [Clostridia bacterium]
MINFKIRLKNKTFLLSFLSALLSFVYIVLSAFDVVPKITQNDIQLIFIGLVDILALLGIVVDPTTKGISDSCDVVNKTPELNGCSFSAAICLFFVLFFLLFTLCIKMLSYYHKIVFDFLFILLYNKVRMLFFI